MDYVFDMDGTLADASHRLHFIEREPKDWDSFFEAMGDDKPIRHVIAIARALEAAGHGVDIWTGRPNGYRRHTVRWLEKHGVPWHWLRMRDDGDRRPDHVVKMEWLAEMTSPIDAVFEDRMRVVAAWRAAGVPCYQVASGNF